MALATVSGFAQSGETSESAETSVERQSKNEPAVMVPKLHDVHGISIGMSEDEVKDKLGKPETSDNSGMYYTLNNGESIQLSFDSDKKVALVAAIYSGKDANAPEIGDVLGTDSSNISPDNGKLYKMIRYPSAGYWVSYSRLDLENGPMTTVTIQKIERP